MSEIAKFNFAGCKVLVTGGTSGIGGATVAAFAAAGAHVVTTGTRESMSDYPAGTFPAGVAYQRLQLDSLLAIDQFAAGVEEVDVLINNAGDIMATASFHEVLQVNLGAVFQLSSALHKKLTMSTWKGGASVVNLASMMSFFGSPHLPGYGAAKAGVVQLTKSLAAGWATDQIRVNAVAAGSVRTNMTMAYADDPHWSKLVSDKTPMRRWGAPSEIAAAIMFLASPAASFVTGHTMVVDGGYSIID